jgi:hypothetical protein
VQQHIHIVVDDRSDVEGQQLRSQQTANHRKPQWLPRLSAGFAFGLSFLAVHPVLSSKTAEQIRIIEACFIALFFLGHVFSNSRKLPLLNGTRGTIITVLLNTKTARQ